MKVQYTIPGWEPAVSTRAAAEPNTPFEARLRQSSATLPPSSRDILGLNRPGPGPSNLAPPPRPATLAYSDIDEERRIWRSLLRRQDEHPPSDPAAFRMLAVLGQMQRLEDAVTARALVDSRG